MLDGDAVVWRDPAVAHLSRATSPAPSTHVTAAGSAGADH